MPETSIPPDPNVPESHPAPVLPKPVAGRIVVPGAVPIEGPEAPAGSGKAAQAGPRVRWSPVATVCLVLAIGVLVAVERIGAESGFRTFRFGVWLAVSVLTLAVLASLLPWLLRREGALLAWNGLGLTIGVLGLGVLGVSSMLALPPVLVGVALTSWPRSPDDADPVGDTTAPDAMRLAAFVSGLLVVPMLAVAEWLWLRGG